VTTEVAESSSAQDALTVEEVMELVTCWYIYFPGVGVIDLEAPQLPERVLEVATERMFTEPSIWKQSQRSRRRCKSTSVSVASLPPS
jgi:hypothetical protein